MVLCSWGHGGDGNEEAELPGRKRKEISVVPQQGGLSLIRPGVCPVNDQ